MDLSLTRESVRVGEPVLESSAEHPVDCEIILPDYCPDIARVLKTHGAAYLISKNMDGGKLTVNGNFCLKILYIPENASSVRCVNHSLPFSHSFDLRDTGEGGYARVKTRVVFVNCRPTGPRRLQVRASVALSARAVAPKEENFVSDCDNSEVELLKKPLKILSFVGAADKDFKANGEAEIGNGKAPAATVLKTDAAAVVQDQKVVGNKVIVKGEALGRTLYACEDGHLENVEYSIPISQIIDLDGVGEDCDCEVRFTAGEARVETEPDAEGENRILTVELDISAQVKASRPVETYTVADAFSTQYDMELKARPLNLETLVDHVRAGETVRLPVEDAGNEIASVADCTVTPVISGTKFDGRALIVEGNMEVSLLAFDSQQSPVSLERSIPFSLREELAGQAPNMRCDPDLTVLSAECGALGGGRLEVRAECLLEAPIFGLTQSSVVSDMLVDDSKEKSCPPRKTLTLYYADKGEKIWDVAKRFNTPMNLIMAENNLDAEELEERKMLLIPKARCAKK